MAPAFYSSFWSNLPTWDSPLGRSTWEKEVIPYGPYLEDDVDLGGSDVLYEGTQANVVARQMLRTFITLAVILLVLPFLILKALVKCVQI